MFTRPLRQIQARADAAGDIDWPAQIDSTIVRAHQHAAATGRNLAGPGLHSLHADGHTSPNRRAQFSPAEVGMVGHRHRSSAPGHPRDGARQPVLTLATELPSGVGTNRPDPFDDANRTAFEQQGIFFESSGRDIAQLPPDGTDPSEDECRASLAEHGTHNSDILDQDEGFCVKTGAGRTAYIRVIDSPSGLGTLRLTVTVWELPS